MSDRWKLVRASLGQFVWPGVIALSIAVYQLFSPWKTPPEVSEAFKSFFAALFFIMYFYGQYKRVEKQTDDKQSFKDVTEKLVSLEDLVRGLDPSITAAQVQPVASATPTTAETLIQDAKQLLTLGHPLAALLQGGVAFEHSIRNFARRYNAEQADRAPLLDLIRKLELVIPQGAVGELHALRQVRNRLTHISERELADLPNAELILRNYEWAVSQLDRGFEDFRVA